ARPDTISYIDLIQRYARIAGLPWRVPVPVLGVPRSAVALAAVLTPYPSLLVRALVESLGHDLVALSALPPPPGGALSVDRALRLAIGHEIPEGPSTAAAALRDHKVTKVAASTARLWSAITAIGGTNGWHTPPGAWELRGAVDHLLGGIGLHHGRPTTLAVGDAVDTWTVVERSDAESLLVLRADMKLPGTAWLSMRAVGGARQSQYEQTVTFVPDGLLGRAYWRLQRPAHDLVFGLMARGMARAAEAG
ncbi:MAG: SDR family oxidoreductase, partial [Actinomycetota bacterium]|nr:SDR family oxidoreductase [Actinomycetota bacterium]